MNILVACEESQRVCLAFLDLGFNAFSADVQICSGGRPERHLLGDVVPLLNGHNMTLAAQDGTMHFIEKWDCIIAHPPCTYLSKAGLCRLIDKNGSINIERYKKGLAARDFFYKFYHADCDYIAIENPIPIKRYNLPEYDQIIQPFYFGDPYYKTTCLWLKNLPWLEPTKICENPIPTSQAKWWNNGKRSERSKNRSKTFSGIAHAMADQWGKFLLTGTKQLELF